MLFYKQRRELRKVLSSVYNYYRILFITDKNKTGRKILEIDISTLHLNRYLFSFLKFFALAGYTIYLPRKRSLILAMYNQKAKFTFMPTLLREGFIKFGKPKKKGATILINSQKLSNNYFQPFLQTTIHPGNLIIPICEFPTFYTKNNDKEDYFSKTNRKCSVFMAGNIDIRYYSKISDSKFFRIQSRWHTARFLKNKPYFTKILNYTGLIDFIDGDKDGKLILINTQEDFRIEREKLKEVNSNFEFYLALSGIDMPLSHNIIEAISSGCIPILHKTYANLFSPPFENKINALVYETLDELDEIIKNIPNHTNKNLDFLRSNLKKYYFEHLSPKAIVAKIECESFNKIYILAEADSLALLKIN